jgi:Ser/Thr protein kinase RdoA (MazF antagonist)
MSFFDIPVEQQIETATAVARRALRLYELPAACAVELVNHRENSVFALIGPGGDKLGAMRVHVPGYQSAATIRSELVWMRALDAAGVRTPGVVAARDGSWVVSLRVPDEAGTRLVDVLEWIEGRSPVGDELIGVFHTLGELHARCHLHASTWELPRDFTRQRWDESTLLRGEHPTVAPAWENWALSKRQKGRVLRCRDLLAEQLARWGKGRDRFGIIHSDLMPENLILSEDGVRIIDFDDAGFGWYLYDAASALLVYYGTELYEPLLDAWGGGYRRHRTLAAEDLAALPTFLMLRCFYALGWLHLRRNTPWAAAFIEPVLERTQAIGSALLDGE